MDVLLEMYSAKYPIGRCGVPDDIANSVLFLASDHASFITGTLLVADGGHLAASVSIDI